MEPVDLGFNYEAHNAAAYKFNNFHADVSAIDKHLSVVLANLYCTCTETAISELSIKILTLPLNSATTMVRVLRLLMGIYHYVTFTLDPFTLSSYNGLHENYGQEFTEKLCPIVV